MHGTDNTRKHVSLTTELLFQHTQNIVDLKLVILVLIGEETAQNLTSRAKTTTKTRTGTRITRITRDVNT